MVAFGIVGTLLFLLMLAVLELNKNTLLGFILLAVVTVCFALLYIKVLHDQKWYWRLLGWIGWIGAFLLIVNITWPPMKLVPAYEGKTPTYTEVVSLEKGDVRGVIIDDGKVELYAGIPYAKPPVGDLRWREPQDPDAWDGVLNADHFAPMCMQPRLVPILDSLKQVFGYHDYVITLNDNYRPAVSEDGLYVNVWKPAGTVENRPVLVYIHGGTLQSGQTWYPDYAGTGLANKGVIVVNFGYRLGIFGYFADEALAAESPNGTTGNYGLLDQIKALEWVRDNIAAFGGDPNNVTLAGESAGSAAVSAICTSPLGKGLFRRVLLESSTVASTQPPHSFRSYEDAISSGKELKARYGATTIEDMRRIDAQTLVNEAYTQHYMTVDGYALTETPYESYRKGVHNEEEILHGYNAEESGPFVLFSQANLKNYEEKVRGFFGEYADDVLQLYRPTTNAEAKSYWAQIYGAIFFNYPHYCLNRLAAENGIPVYEYYFTKHNGRLGAWHSGEQYYFYGNIPEGSRLFDENDRALERTTVRYLISFMTDGDPNAEGLPAWEVSSDSARVLELGDTVGMTDEKYLAFYAILDRMTGWGKQPVDGQ